jgi:pimeloyl-ACP methyl ester carboxylesterase
MVLKEASARPQTGPRIEPLLSCRLFMAPQLVGDRLFFISNMSGRFSLYAMDRSGSVPEPLLPPDIALQNPELMGGRSFYVFPDSQMIVVMIDSDGDENYQFLVIPIDGGLPHELFDGRFARYRCSLTHCDHRRDVFYMAVESREEAITESWECLLAREEPARLFESPWGASPVAASDDGSRVVIGEGYTLGDVVLFLWEGGTTRVIYGTTIEEQPDRSQVPPCGIRAIEFSPDGGGLLLISAVFDDTYGLGYLDLSRPGKIEPVKLTGTVHSGAGEMESLDWLRDDRYSVRFNIDGVSWLYEGVFDEEAREVRLEQVLVGEGELANGTLEHADYDDASDSFALSFSTATTPTQLFVRERTPRETALRDRGQARRVTRERVLGIPQAQLSAGEDASFSSFDGLRISARLYLPTKETADAPYPLVYYVHGGPQGQERPNFAWFSMPLIQFLTLNGFAVFVPNVRGSAGYGQKYMKLVDRDWGGDDRLDHVHAMTEVLPRDSRLDVSRAGVMGRSYGGYMTLTLASRHPELWRAAIDMFGPYNLLTFVDRLPKTWKPYFKIALGDPEADRDFLLERSPVSYIDQLSCPLFVIQGKNDPRVVEEESHDVVRSLEARGKTVNYLVFENEGHDVIKYENRVRCYTAINDFFKQHL